MNRHHIWSLLLALCAAPALAATINIPADYSAIMDGISAASDGDTVLVAPGNYQEKIDFHGKEIVVGSYFLTTGDRAYIDSTRLDGYRQEYLPGIPPGYHIPTVMFRSGESRAALLTGFTIWNGESFYGGAIRVRDSSPTISDMILTDCYAQYGGAIYCTDYAYPHFRNVLIAGDSAAFNGGGVMLDVDAFPTFTDVVIRDNIAADSGGGVYCLNSRPDSTVRFIRGEISGNRAVSDGGGIFCSLSQGSVVIQGTRIINNVSGGNGGGIYCVLSEESFLMQGGCIQDNIAGGNGGGIYCAPSDGSFLMQGGCIQNNIAEGYGGGVYAGQSPVSLAQCVFSGNRALAGGGIYLTGGVPQFNFLTFANDSALQGRAIYADAVDDISLTNSIFYGSTKDTLVSGRRSHIGISYCDIRGGPDWIGGKGSNEIDWGDGNMDNDPVYRDGSGGDYRLGWGSPCVDVGDPDAPDDPDNSRADIGALPYHHYPTLLFGRVTASFNGAAIEGARVFTSNGAAVTTGADGSWLIREAFPLEPFTLSAQLPRFITGVSDGLYLETDDTLRVDFALNRPLFTPSQSEIFVQLAPDSSRRKSLQIQNQGDGTLRWTLSRRVAGINVAPWERLASIDLSGIEDVQDIGGVAFANGRFYLTCRGGGGTFVAILNRDGEYVDQFSQFGGTQTGMLDLSWDGQLIWGAEGGMMFGFTPQGQVSKQWDWPHYLAQNIAWDSHRDYLWCSSISGDRITAFHSAGDSVGSLSQDGMRVQGMDCRPDDPDGYDLYLLNNPDLNRSLVTRMNVDNGDTETVAELQSDGATLRGAFITDQYIPFATVFMSILHGQDSHRLEIYLIHSDPAWLSVEPDSGEIGAGESRELTLALSAADLDTCTLEAELCFSFPDVQDSVVIPVTLLVNPNSVSESGNRISEFGLSEAYPNPFNQSTVISYQLPLASRVSLFLYDIAGREIMSQQLGIGNPGSHRTVIDGSDLSSGVYLLKLIAGEQAAVRKVVCVK